MIGVNFLAVFDAAVGDVVESDVADDISGPVVSVQFMTKRRTRRCLNTH